MPRGEKVRKAPPVEPATTSEVREWAREQGLDVAAKGRLSRSVIDAFTEATGRTIG